MHVMYDMYDPNGSLVEWSAARSVRMRVLHQPLADLSLGCLEVGISDIRASHVVPSVDDQAKGWRPWLDDFAVLLNCCLLFIVPFF